MIEAAAGGHASDLRSKGGVRAFLREVERRDEGLGFLNKVHKAAFEGDLEALEECMEVREEEQFTVESPHPRGGHTLLHTAVRGLLPAKTLEFLVKRFKADLNSRDARGRTPLLWAAAIGAIRSITRLISLGADEHAADDEGCNAIFLAAEAGYAKTVFWLHRAGVQLVSTKDGRSALHAAAFMGRVDLARSKELSPDCTVTRLILVGADMEAGTVNGFTAMHWAALGDQAGAITRLNEHGAIPNPDDKNGLTPLMVAAAYGNLAAVEALVKLEVNVAITDKRGYSPMHFAAEKGHLGVVMALFKHVPLLAVREPQNSAAALAADQGLDQGLQGRRRRRMTLGLHLADIVQWRTNSGETPFTLASRNDRDDILEHYNMAMLFKKVPDMAEHELVLQLDVYGLEWDPRTESSGYARDKFMKFLKDHFGMHKNALPYY